VKICVISIATNGYEEFLPALYTGIDQFFLTDHEVSKLLFTDRKDFTLADKTVQVESEPWPLPTLKRYEYFYQERSYLSEFDYCFYLDADMLMVGPVQEEILGSGITGTLHPMQTVFEKFTYDRSAESTATIPYGEGTNYYCGGFQGGKTPEFLQMSEILMRRIHEDNRNEVVALWHDESHLNRYLIDYPPAVVLGRQYCNDSRTPLNVPPKIIAIRKEKKWNAKK
jgi:histo-blood group ABO system transferase